VQRLNTAEASGLAAPSDNDDLPYDIIERDDDDNDITQTVSTINPVTYAGRIYGEGDVGDLPLIKVRDILN